MCSPSEAASAVCFWDMIWLWSPGWPGTHNGDQADLKSTDNQSSSASRMLGLKAWVTMPVHKHYFLHTHCARRNAKYHESQERIVAFFKHECYSPTLPSLRPLSCPPTPSQLISSLYRCLSKRRLTLPLLVALITCSSSSRGGALWDSLHPCMMACQLCVLSLDRSPSATLISSSTETTEKE